MTRYKVEYTYHTGNKCQICGDPSSLIVEYLNHNEEFITCEKHTPKTYEKMMEFVNEKSPILL